jgi:hypothetical protein
MLNGTSNADATARRDRSGRPALTARKRHMPVGRVTLTFAPVGGQFGLPRL